MNLESVLNHRRSVRVYDEEKKINSDIVKHCIELATLAPNSSNMQLWEFYHIKDSNVLSRMSKACLNQTAVKTASELVVFVTRQDLFRKRIKSILEFEKVNIERNSPIEKQESRMKDRKLYYRKLMPFLYTRFFGLLGLFRKLLMGGIGIFRPIVRQVSENDTRIVVHKSNALAAQTFMIAMANEGYDTCPLEGFDSRRIKKILNLPYSAEITMVVSCGIRKGNDGIWGERYRVPFEQVYHKI